VLPQAKQAGFSDAYIAKEDGGEAVGLDRVERVSTPVPKAAPAPREVPKSASTPTTNSTYTAPAAAAPSAGAYLIRLATYGNFNNFDSASIARLGTLTTRTRGEYTVVLVQGFGSVEAAKAKVEEARKAGFADAHVVSEEADGTLRKVR